MEQISTDVMPEIVWNDYKQVLDLTEVEAVVHRNGFGRMVLTHGSGRVRGTIEYRINGKKWAEVGTTLHIDGKRVPNAASMSQYAFIFNNPDASRHNWTPEGAEKADLGTLREAADEVGLPNIEAVIGPLKKAQRDKKSSIGVYLNGKDDLVIRVASADPTKLTVNLVFSERGDVKGETQLHNFKTFMLVNVDGYDVTPWHQGQVESFLLDILGADSRKNQNPLIPQVRQHGQSGKANSVAVRNATVIRN